MPYREEVLATRRKWIDYLMAWGRRKTKGQLDRGHGKRCCLGHGAKVIGCEMKSDRGWITYDEEDQVAPDRLIEEAGLLNADGEFQNPNSIEVDGKIIDSLTSLNDSTDWSPRQIGEFLLQYIEGGGPFHPLSEYRSKPQETST